MLEATQHEFNTFATLTFKNRSHFYVTVKPRELNPRDLVLFLKRLRKARGPFRYFGVGEYGDQTWRPHYHLALFGISALESQTIETAWGHGHIHVGDLTHESCGYIAGYVTKKMTAADDPRLQGWHPEFTRMSLKNGGIGRGAVSEFGYGLTKEGGALGLSRLPDVPKDIRLGGKKYPLGRYLTRALREEVGWNPDTPKEVTRAIAYEKSLMTGSDITRSESKRAASAASAESRSKIQRSKRRL